MLLLLLAVSCSEYNLDPRGDDVEPPACEAPGFDVPLPTVDPECAGEPQVGSFTPSVEWTWTDNPVHPGYQQVMAAPAAGDVNDDGIPDVVFTAFSGGAYGSAGALVCISGADGATLWSVTEAGGAHPYGASGVAIADLYASGDPTVLVSSDQGLLAVDGTGAFRWVAATPASTYGHPAVGDIDGDGVSEIIYGRTVVNADGTVRWTGTGGTGGGSWMAFPADVDQDGLSEVVAGNTLYEHDGTIRWQDGGADGYPAIADLDLDGVPEIIRVGGGVVRASRIDGSLVWDFPITDGGGGPPTVADFDGDGAPEIGVASRSVYRVIEADGTERWSTTVQDYSSSVTGSSVFDFEGDGAAEVVYADEETLWVYDGSTGAVEMSWTSHSSGTLWEYPLIVDIDADGATEIVVASNDYAYAGSRGITVVGDQADSWAPARGVWNQHAYSIDNVRDDGSVPVFPLPSWRRANSFRAGNSETAVGLAQADLDLGEPDVCAEACAQGAIVVNLPLSNRGLADADGVHVRVYAVEGGEESLVLEEDVGTVAAGAALWVGPYVVPNAEEVVLRVSTGSVNECDTANNEIRLDGGACGDSVSSG